MENKLKTLDTILEQISIKSDIEVFIKLFSEALKKLNELKSATEKEQVKLRAEFSQKVGELERLFNSKMSNDNNKMSSEMMRMEKEMMNYCSSEMERMTKEHDGAMEEQENALNFIRDKVRKIKEGIDGEKGKDGKDGSPDTPEQVRDKLETLKDEERLDVSAIKGIEKMIKDLELKIPKLGGGGFSVMAWTQHIVDDETPTGTVNGVNTDFVLNLTPSPANSLKVYVNGQRMKLTTDYTLSGRTITFLTAPPTGSILTADYKV